MGIIQKSNNQKASPGRTFTEFRNETAFAALKRDGSVVTWGGSWGGNSSSVASQLSSGVAQIFSNHTSFAALKKDGSVVTWGDSSYGGDSRMVASQLSSGVVQIHSTYYDSFAALKTDSNQTTNPTINNGMNLSMNI